MIQLDPCFKTWSRQGPGYIFISEKPASGPGWKDHSFKWPDDKQNIIDFVGKKDKTQTNLYWAPLVFNKPRRLEENVTSGNILFADLDPVDPKTLNIRPTLAWESSNKRYAAIWFVKETLPPGPLRELNRGLTYEIGADKGGWDLTQVLRIPGSKNYKYNPSHRGKLLWFNKSLIYNKENFQFKEEPKKPEENTQTLIELLSKYRKKIPSRVSRLLQYPESRVELGRRSDMLWYIESELVKAQIPLEDIILMVKLSAWNKYRGRRDEWKRLTTEISKVYNDAQGEIQAHIGEEDGGGESGLPWETFGGLMGSLRAQPGWLIKNIWMRRSHGMVAGEPKTFKSTVALDMAISVASGEPLFGEFEVMESGPVLVIQNENSKWIMKDRMEKILNNKKIVGKVVKRTRRTLDITFAKELPIYFLNNYGYTFSDPLHRKELEQAINEIKPVMVVLDPLYLMFDGDINSAKDLNPILSWLLELKNVFNTSIVVVHHWNKGGTSSRGGQRMLGSTTLHGWVESALYMESSVDEEGPQPVSRIIIEREFRAAGLYPKLELQIAMGDFGTPLYEPTLQEIIRTNTLSDLMDLLSMYPNGISLRQASKDLNISRDKVEKLVSKSQGKIIIQRGGQQGKSATIRMVKEGKE